ncbi:MAG: hypothetical protein ABIO49_05170, partial [Dokdonella sp.]
ACNATFSKASKEAGKDAEEYSLDKDNSATLFEVTSAHDKVIEGRFQFHRTSKAGQALVISGGAFVAEDRNSELAERKKPVRIAAPGFDHWATRLRTAALAHHRVQ